MDEIKVGLKATYEYEVVERYTTARGDYKVFSTPSMCLLAEQSSQKLIAPYLKPGQGQVGTFISIRHMAATPMGKTVRAEVEVVEIDRRRINFSVNFFDDVEQVGEVKHERFVIDVEKYRDRLKKKAAG
jgi:fluoroacetyl-CoA thioesterase